MDHLIRFDLSGVSAASFGSASLAVGSQDAELWVSALNAARDIANGKVPGQALEICHAQQVIDDTSLWALSVLSILY